MNVSSNSRVGMIGSVQSTRKNHPGWDNPRDCQTVRRLNYENRKEIVVYQQNAATIFRGKNTIFELTHMVKAASCRAYPEKLSGL
jgi:hypothetical protein